MKPERKIRIEMTPYENSSRPEIVIEKECDEILLGKEYYEVVRTGCCGAENELELYYYESKLIIEGISSIIKCKIPNSPIEFFASFSKGLNISYSSSDQYFLDIKFDSLLSN
jgi:hypothetical protein